MLERLGHSPTPVTLTVAVTSVKKIPSDDIYQEAANTSQSKARGGSTHWGRGIPLAEGAPSPQALPQAQFPLHRTTGNACF